MSPAQATESAAPHHATGDGSASPAEALAGQSSLARQPRDLAGADDETIRFQVLRAGREVAVELISPLVALSIPIPDRTSTGNGAYRASPRRTVRAPRPMELGLARETARDRAAKQAGVNREVSIGDADFDREVFVHTHAPDDVVRAVLGDEGLRNAILDLLREEAVYLMIDDRHGTLTAHFADHDKLHDPARAERILDTLLLVFSLLPSLQKTGALRTRWSVSNIGLLILAIWLPGAVLCFLQMSRGFTAANTIAASASWGPLLIGVLVGALASLPVRLVVFYAVRGQFHSATKQRLIVRTSTILLMQIAMLFAGHVW